MSEIELIENLKKTYNGFDLNEAEVRFKIIDEILEKYLKWPKSKSFVEVITDGNRADYVLYGNGGKPVLIIESKRKGVYFQLPNQVNLKNTFQKVTVEKLLTSKSVKDAMLQVKEYCEDLLCSHAAICNGKTWIIFKVISTNQKPWKKLSAYVIRDFDFFSKNYTEAINLLGYTSVVKLHSLQKTIGINSKAHLEIYFPKDNITAYDTPVNSNKYAGSFSILSRRYLGAIPESDSDFMTHCYVVNKGHYDTLQKNVQGFLFDSLTPYFKNQGFRDFSDDKNGGAFGLKIAQMVRQQNLDNVMILFGGRGSGKSTFLKRFLFHIRPKELQQYSIIALVDLLNSSQTESNLTNEIWDDVLKQIDKNKIYEGERSDVLSLFSKEFDVYSKQILFGLPQDSEKYHELTRAFFLEKLNDRKSFAEKISLYWKQQNKGLIIFLDNMDQLSPELQDVCYLTAVEIAKKLGCLVIISMREERFYNAKSKGVLDAYHTPGFHLSAPVIPEVIVKRIDYILEQLRYTADVEHEYGISSDAALVTLQNFFRICLYQIKNKESHLSYFLRYATHGDVRQALEFFKGFLTSGYTNVDEVAENTWWSFQIHQVIKPMMIPDRVFYDEKLSRIPNIMQLRSDVNSSHFTGLRILNLLHNKSTAETTSGFIDAKYFVQEFEEKYSLKEDCEHHLNVFLNKGLIESSNRLEDYNDKVDQIKITAFGKYIYEFLAFDFSYIDLISMDCGVFSEDLFAYLSKSANEELKLRNTQRIFDRMKLRIERAEKFISYLEIQEYEELTALGIGIQDFSFSAKIKLAFNENKDRILNGAKRNDRTS
ncbi:hypothetical protein [Mucilaginibacter sp. L3T2-6]|uniref:hypothetical protein n=1 Tax=Mucilaginibacter sp. L3T2-6 TaxID=3062491 RepID=UPI0026747F63|nr:hypothetical protein [Mucilaginibacter sp. L3T2-6]MDO3641420.1 hypothetical protein [Mucilaginibacter sp. L3T2-6]MDV6213819.1 hypothetical protein [Mucilaginibacter sp. L3T2-6]